MPFQNLTGRGTPPPDRRHPGNALTLSELPEPPIPVSEIGPIPPPPMFSSPSPTLLLRQGSGIHNAVPLGLSDFIYVGKCKFNSTGAIESCLSYQSPDEQSAPDKLATVYLY